MTIQQWILKYREGVKYSVEACSIDVLKEWSFDQHLLARKDKAYFSVKAIASNHPFQHYRQLPIIDQPEIGILGFIVSFDQEDWKILLQAKSEPGNVHMTQIGPSVQATYSNYMSVHGGKKQPYLEFFLSDQVRAKFRVKQSEQGTRFYNKYNLNVIVPVSEHQIVIQEEKYKWFHFSEIIPVLVQDYVFNTDFKSVSTQLLELYIHQNKHKYTNPIVASYYNNVDDGSVQELLKKIETQRNQHKIVVDAVKLTDLKDWEISDRGIHPKVEKEFGFSYYDVWLEDREITHWSQPLISKKSIEYIDLYVCEKDGEYHFIFSERYEIGFKNVYQLGPTLQFDSLTKVEDTHAYKELISFKQSEEGGRFYRNISEYRLLLIDSYEEFKDKEGYVILNIYQLCALLKIEGVFTNEARSILSSLFSLL